MVWQRWTNYGQNLVLDVLWGKDQVMPDTLYLAQIVTLPTDTSTGSTIVEPSDANYARQTIDNSAAGSFWNAAASQLKTNAQGLTWAAAATDWEAVPYYGICDAASGGNLLLYGDHSDPFIILAGQYTFLLAGQLSQVATGPIQAEEI